MILKRDNEMKLTKITMMCVLAATMNLAQANTVSKAVLKVGTAQQLVNTSLNACAKDGYSVAVAVVDRSGVLKAFARSENAGPHTVDSAIRKAYTAATLGRLTADLAKMVVEKPELSGLKDMDDHLLFLAGGVPITDKKELIGGIGIGGAPGGHLDQACAEAAIKEIFKP